MTVSYPKYKNILLEVNLSIQTNEFLLTELVTMVSLLVLD